MSQVMHFVRKAKLTMMNFRQTAHHHYGGGLSSYFKLVYISGFRVNRFLLFEKDLTSEFECLPLDNRFRLVSPGPEELVELRNGRDLPREFYADQTYGLKTCYIALEQDKIAYVQWHIFNGDYSRFLKLPDGVVEFNYMVVMPEFRGQSISTKMVSCLSNVVRDQGYRKAVAVIHNQNFPAIKAYRKAGFVETDEIVSVGQFNRKYAIAGGEGAC